MQSLDIITSTPSASARSTGTRISGMVIVPSGSMVPGGTGPALQPIPMGGITHPAKQVMTGPSIITPFMAIPGRAYVQ